MMCCLAVVVVSVFSAEDVIDFQLSRALLAWERIRLSVLRLWMMLMRLRVCCDLWAFAIVQPSK